MPMTMQETREAILAMLGDANGLKPHRYSPYTYGPVDYVAPGNYAEAESVKRGEEGDTFYWSAYSFYEKDSYQKVSHLQTQLERVFADNEWCLDAHANICHEENDDLAHRVEYRFHTFGTEGSTDPDGPDFCPSCGWNTSNLKCNAVPDDHPVEDCHYLCANCGLNTGITGPCLRMVTFTMTVRYEVFLNDSPNVISNVSPDVNRAVGEILIGYALAENNLRALMVNAPGYSARSNLSTDIERLEKHKEAIVASYTAQSYDGGQAMEECIAEIVSAFDRIHAERTALAHGQLVSVGLSTSTITKDGINREKEEGSRLQMEHHRVSVELTEDGIKEPLDNIRELQAQVGRLGRILEFLGPRGRF